MTDLIAADLLKLRRRRGLFWTLIALPLVIAALAVVLELTVVTDPTSPADFLEAVTAAQGFVALLAVVVAGARLGSEEHAGGTIRYQVLTGMPRGRLYASKAAVVVLVALAVALLGTVGALAGVPFADGAGDGVDLAAVLGAFWAILLRLLVYGLIAFGVGALVRSTGPAIAASVVLAIGGTNILLLLTLLSDGLVWLSPDVAIERLTYDDADPGDRIALVAAIGSVLAWSLIPVAAGLARLRRLEL
jgi:ABC-type transport system involved in multi-copper enzyme maturation permease subunit